MADKKKKSTLLQIIDKDVELTKSRVENELVDMLIYGISGTWKSPLLASVSKIESLKPIYIDIESGAHAAYKAGITVVELSTYLEARQKDKPSITEFQALLDLFKDLAIEYETNKSFNCILLDGYTEIYEIIHSQAKLDGSGDKEVGTQNDRTRSLVRTKQFVRALRSIPVHIISTAREYTFIADSGAIMERGPHLSGATMRYVAAQSDIVARLRVVGNKLKFSVKEDSVTIARDRFFVLPDNIMLSTPSLKEVWDYIKGKSKR